MSHKNNVKSCNSIAVFCYNKALQTLNGAEDNWQRLVFPESGIWHDG